MRPISPHTFDWRNVRGWLTEAEAAELARLATGKTVLEIGTFCGRSAIAMAATARKMYCLDTFNGYSCDESHYKVRDEAFGNFDRAGYNGKIVVLAGSQEDVLPHMNLKDVDLVFYDADHSFDATLNGIHLLLDAGLPDTATIVFHDYSEGDPGVVMAVNNYCFPLGIKPRVVDTLAIVDGKEKAEILPIKTTCHKIMLAIPTAGYHLVYGAAQGLFRASWKHEVTIDPGNSSILSAAFNRLLCNAFNRYESGTITHLAFLHSDIEPCDGWIDILIEEMEKKGVSFCSAVSPIKDQRGLTSTGLGESGFTWSPLRRFTMREIMKFPVTFNVDDIGYPGKVLLLNSGCWVADLRDQRFFTMNGDNEAVAFFQTNDRVVKTEGKWVSQVESEDWFFSRRLFDLDIPVAATRAVGLRHWGIAAHTNNSEWGSLDCDEDLRPLWEKAVNNVPSG